VDKFVLRIVRCSGCGAGIWCWIILGCPSPATFVTQRGHQRGPFPFAADPAGAHRYRSIALIEIAEAIEALLQVLRASSLLLPNGRARDESTPAEVRHAVVRPSWPSKATASYASAPEVGRSHKCLAKQDPGIIHDHVIRREPVVPVVLIIIGEPVAVVPLGTLGQFHAGQDHGGGRLD